MDRSVVVQGAGLLGGALVGLAVAWYRPRRALAIRARDVRRALPTAAADLAGRAGEAIVLEGTLVALRGERGAPTVVSVVPRGAELLEEPTAKALTVGAELGVRLDPAGGRPGAVVALEGRVQVLVGSADTGRAVPAARARAWMRGLAHASLPGTEVSMRSLSAGDRVLAAGVLRAAAAGDRAADSPRPCASGCSPVRCARRCCACATPCCGGIWRCRCWRSISSPAGEPDARVSSPPPRSRRGPRQACQPGPTTPRWTLRPPATSRALRSARTGTELANAVRS